MPIDLRISAESVEEFDTLLARFASSAGGVMPEVMTAAAAAQVVGSTQEETEAPLEDKPKPRGRKARETAAEPTQQPDGTPIAPVHTPEPQPTPGGTDAPPAESIPPKQEVVEPETVAASPAATSPIDQGAAAQGEVTVQNLKDAMADLLKAKSASMAMQVLNDVAGCKSLTSGSPNVVEKAKEDPTLMRRVLDALVAAKTAA